MDFFPLKNFFQVQGLLIFDPFSLVPCFLVCCIITIIIIIVTAVQNVKEEITSKNSNVFMCHSFQVYLYLYFFFIYIFIWGLISIQKEKPHLVCAFYKCVCFELFSEDSKLWKVG